MSQGAGPQAANAAAAKVRVQIDGSGGPVFVATIRKVGDPIPNQRVNGPTWVFDLDPGDWLFNVNITGIAGVKASFTVAGATTPDPTSFVIPGQPGQARGINREIELNV